MTGERWEQIVALFELALEQPPEERPALVAREAGTDLELRLQVLAMLDADARTHPALDESPDPAPPRSGPGDLPLEGETIGPYTVIKEIGRGGMATVYEANDAKHKRPVALKLLHLGASYVLGGERFRREIEVLARLQHPHILPLYDSGEAGNRLYYVMPLVRGETLRDRIAREGPLPIDDVRRITAEVGTALDYAHRHGVVHRDVKPANILLDDEHAAVTDFGIAHTAMEDSPERLTSTGIVMGTPAYMSPEQALGARELDAGTDIYSLGCVVFEMLAGRPPYVGPSSPAVVSEHLHAAAPSILPLRPGLVSEVDEVLRRALAKDRGQRFGSMREFVQAVDQVLALSDGVLGGTAGRRATSVDWTTPRSGHLTTDQSRRRWPWLVGMVGGLAVVAVILAQLTGGGGTGPTSIVVLPFANMSADRSNEYFSDGVTEELTGALAELGRIRVTPRTTAFAYKGRTGDLRRIGEELGVTRILEGSVRRDSGQVLVQASLYDAVTGDRLWHNQYQRPWGSMLELQAEIAGTIAEQLELNLLPDERARLIERHTVDADAYDSYLRGRHFFDLRTAASLEQAVIHFQQALAIDSNYARAHAGLADTYSIQAWTGTAAPGDLFPRAEREARRALSLDSTLAEAHVSLGIIHTFHTWDWAAADRASARAVALDSTRGQAWFFRTWPLVAMGRMSEAMEAIERARRLEPLALITNARVATVLAWLDRYDAADSVLQRTLEIDPSYPVAQVQRARVLSLKERHADAIAALPSDSVRLGSYESGIAGWVYARAGQRDRAISAARALESREYPPAEGIAAIYLGLGQTETALSWLERAVDARGVGLIFLMAEPIYDPLHGQPRFQRVVQRIGLGTGG